ncbi:tetratricopeptide repeat protein [Maribacter sp. ACAM166]|uniref:tetratricopeptide repeat protein n=1 Tax=Maribacter sp. ACAM166 TaxID=2508996 RepID=UPI0010FEAACC|nr:tetratricopeptide repeat protein [Maribacter sp. ACAM166]TLP82346.1 tetratricopeptide repeat protein [Maribacter sp. ACAM166]
MSESCIKHIENAWKAKTETSNVLFKEGHYSDAMTGYMEALYRAELLNDYKKEVALTGIPFLQIFAISCNNIAYTYKEMGLAHKGEKMLKRVVYYLLSLYKSDTIHNEELQNELKRAILNYSEYAEKNGLKIENADKLFSNIQEHLS